MMNDGLMDHTLIASQINIMAADTMCRTILGSHYHLWMKIDFLIRKNVFTMFKSSFLS